jgi:hypothetical protein
MKILETKNNVQKLFKMGGRKKKRKHNKNNYSNFSDYYDYSLYYTSTKVSSQQISLIAEEIFGGKYYISANDLKIEKLL